MGNASSNINNNSCPLVSYHISAKYIWALGISVGEGKITYAYDLAQWTHLTVVNNSGTNESSLYINGSLVKTGASTSGYCVQNLSAQFRLGKHPYPGYDYDFA